MAPRRKIGKKRVYKRRYTRRGKPSKAIKRYVKSAIHKQIENKRFTIESSDTLAAASNAVNFQAGNIFQLTPSNATNAWYTIPQGTGQGARTGNRISLRSCVFRYAMYPTPYNVASNPTPKPIDVCLWIFSVKRGVLGLTVADAWNIFNNTFFANGSSSNGTVNNLFDMVSVPNSEVVTLHHRRVFKLSPASYYVAGATVPNYDNNDYKYNALGKINVTKYMPKQIVFNDTDNNSTSKQVFMIIAPYNAEGTTIPSTTYPLALFSGLDVVYEDA